MSQNSTARKMAHADPFFTETLADRDPEIYDAIRSELGRQRHEIELIASENIVS
ncbi:MAG: serine hydroxymethyltransferase, partial [Oricola sp.]